MNLKRYEEAADDFSEAIKNAPETKQQGLRDLRKQCLGAERSVSSPTSSALPAQPSSTATSQAEVVLWKSIENNTNSAEFQSYLDQYPNGAFAVLARRHLLEIQEQAGRAQWKAIENSSNQADFQAYLKQYPNGTFATEVRSHLAAAEKAQAEKIAEERRTAIWVDPATSLIWAKKDQGSNVDLQPAMAYCKNLTLAGYSDWRLPTVDELRGIFDKNENVDGSHIPGVKPVSDLLEFRLLKYIVAIVETGNITRASERLFLAQPGT